MTKKQYPTDLTPEQFKLIEPTLRPQSKMGLPRKWDLLDVINAILYLLRSGCAWRLLPHDFPPCLGKLSTLPSENGTGATGGARIRGGKA